LMMAAHDTSTSTITTLFYLLGKNTEWQERLRKEAQAVGSEFISFDDQEKLTELDWCIREALRMYPPLPTMPRAVLQDFEYKGYKIERGLGVSASPIHTHYMEEYWTHPEKFDPERWSPERAEYKKHFYQWIPFGGGAHMCIGQHFGFMEIKAIMHQVLLNFEWHLPENYEMPYQLMPIAKPKDKLPLKLKRLK
jgi:cytochrome P450